MWLGGLIAASRRVDVAKKRFWIFMHLPKTKVKRSNFRAWIFDNYISSIWAKEAQYLK